MCMSNESSFVCVPLADDIKHKEQILEFTIDREAGYAQSKNMIIGLEAYLKRCAWDEDSSREVKIYLIKDINNGSIAAYFGLKAGMVASSGSESLSPEQKAIILKTFKKEHLFPEVLPGIEISHFAINDDYRRRVSIIGLQMTNNGRIFITVWQNESKKPNSGMNNMQNYVMRMLFWQFQC